MLFVFPEPEWLAFVMRDCLVPIDLLYLDDDGRIVNTHSMLPEPPRTDAERAAGSMGDFGYNTRLTPYPSEQPVRLVVELRGGSVERFGLQPGDLILSDTESLFLVAD